MKINKAIKISIVIAIFIVALSIAYYSVILLPKTNTISVTVSNTLNCNKLYELKKTKYWGDRIGQSRAIYNNNLDTCLALNIYSDFKTDKYFAMIMDMSDDSTLMYYGSTPQGSYIEGAKIITCQNNYISFEFIQNGKKVKKYGCDTDGKGRLTDKFNLFDKMFKKVRSFNLKTFDASF
jgi:hypothetical protein